MDESTSSIEMPRDKTLTQRLAESVPLNRKMYGTRPDWDRAKKYRHWCFTVQGWSDERLQRILAIPDWTYVIIGKELGDDDHEHYQGFGSFKSQRYVRAVSDLLGGAWCEPAVNTEACITYCKKEGDFAERGTPPRSAAEVLAGLYDTIASLTPEEDDESDYDDDIVLHAQNLLDEIMVSFDELHPYLEGSELLSEMV